MKYKLFISDYDGTLGEAPANDIDSETVSAINKFIDKGGICQPFLKKYFIYFLFE